MPEAKTTTVYSCEIQREVEAPAETFWEQPIRGTKIRWQGLDAAAVIDGRAQSRKAAKIFLS